MHLINERYAILEAMEPQSIAAAGAATGKFFDTQTRKTFSFSALLGAVTAGKSAKVELLASDAAEGTDAAPVGEVTYTAPAGGVDGHVVTVSGHVTALRGRYLALRVTNNGTAALLASAVLLADSVTNPEDTGGTTLVV
ncbi:MAG TPA: hypothetical protein VN421_09490 [Pseudoflavonifractor sp.]|nr:hypothetical protein [Pseudoflavonifractor sp.]